MDPSAADTAPTSAHRPAVARAAARPGLVTSACFVVAAALTAVLGVGDGRWVPLHLLTVGALLTAIVTTTVYLSVTWSAAAPPGRFIGALPHSLVAAGAVALAFGRTTGRGWLLESGALVVTVGVAVTIPILLAVRRRAGVARFRPAIDAYVAALAAGTIGSVLGFWLVSGRAGTRWLAVRDAHLTLNVFALVGVVLAGTLPYFAATQMRAVMPARATAARIRTVTGALVATALFATAAQLAGADAVAGVALVAYAAAAIGVVSLVPTPTAKRRRWAGPRLVQLGAGLTWWIVATVLVAVAVGTGRDDRGALMALVIGGYAQILVASLAYLGPVLRGGGHVALTAGFRVTASWVSVAAGNAAAVAALVGARELLAGAIIVWMIDLAARAIRLVTARPTT